MNQYIFGFHSNVRQSLLHLYPYCGDHIYWSFWVPGYIYASCYFLPVGTSIKLTGGKITTGIGLSVSILYFLNRTTGWWSAISSTIAECASKDTYVDTFYTSFYLHEYVSLLYCDIMSLYHIILGGRCYITNCHDNNLAHRLCTTWGTLASDSNNFYCPLKYDSTLNSDPHKYFLKISMDNLTLDFSPTKICPDFYSGDTVDIEIK